MHRRKALVLLRDFPFPLSTGARIRTFGLFQELKRDFHLTVICLESVDDPLRLRQADLFCDRLLIRPCCLTRYWWDIFLPGELRVYRRPGARLEIKAFLESGSWELFVCDHLHSSVNVPFKLPVPSVLVQHNVESQVLWRALWRASTFRLKLNLALDAIRLQIFESMTCGFYDLVCTVSDVDKELLRKTAPRSRVEVVENFLVEGGEAPVLPERDEPTVCFVGTLNWFPNDDGVKFFLTNIWPLVIGEVPEARFVLVGGSASESLKALVRSTQGAVMTGFVDRVEPYVQEAWVNVVPLRVGSGTRLKIIEAFRWGKAVVSTSVGAEGLPVNDGEHLLLRDRPDEFARAVVELLACRSKRDEIGHNGARLVKERLNSQVQGGRFRKRLHELVSSSLKRH